MKRAASAAGKKSGGVAKKCRTIASTVREADNIPQPVRSMLCDSLLRTFSTYKAERHPLQASVSDLVGKVLKEAQNKFQAAINEAQQKKKAIETEAAPVTRKHDAAAAASEAAAKALADSKTAVADSKTALKDAKSALHDLKEEERVAASETSATSSKKEKLEELSRDFIGPIKEGAKQGAAQGRHVGKELGSSLEPEFLECVTRTFSKAYSAWGTFDYIVDKKLDEQLQSLFASLAKDLQAQEAAKEARATAIENAKGAVTAAEEKVKAMEEVCGNATTNAKEAETAAKAAAAEAKQQLQQIQKAADSCAHAEAALSAFRNGALAAYTEVEALAAPPPEPEKPAATLVDTAMAPAPAVQAAPSVLPSPGVLLSRVAQAVGGLASSPRTLGMSPRTA